MTPEEQKNLHRILETLEKAAYMLQHSYTACKNLGHKKKYSLSELDLFEALTSRFARLNDIIIRKMFRTIDRLDIEPEGTVRDSINRAEKKGLIDRGDLFGQIREIRNIIAHEYLLEDMSQLYQDVLAGTPILIDVVERVKQYCQRYKNM
jgi:uncharacterized protein YutE (UPF0331/DUF86 family)